MIVALVYTYAMPSGNSGLMWCPSDVIAAEDNPNRIDMSNKKENERKGGGRIDEWEVTC